MRIADVMTPDVQCVRPDCSLQLAARMMRDCDVGILPVTDDDQTPVGVITDRDLVVRGLAAGLDPERTLVGDIMSSEVVCCYEDEPVEHIAQLMEDRQIRRLIIVDQDNCICGIVSLGDVALRAGDEVPVEDVLEDVSWPGHPSREIQGQRGLGSRRRNGPRHSISNGGSMMRPGIGPGRILAGAIVGGALMYLFDPSRGRRRRAVLRDKVIHLNRVAQSTLGKSYRYTRGKGKGWIAETRARMHHEQVDDHRLAERIRSAIGRSLSHPKCVSVNARNGEVVLQGSALPDEIRPAVRAASNVRGVNRVTSHVRPFRQDELRMHANDRTFNGKGRRGNIAGRWTPATRLLGLIAGGTLVTWGATRRDVPGVAGMALGIGLGARALTNVSTRQLLGIGAGGGAIEVQKNININAPLDLVYDFVSNYQSFPLFMSRVREVRQRDDGRSHWVVAGPMGTNVNWDAEVTDERPNELIAWRSVPGSMVENQGMIRVEPNEHGGTRLDVSMRYTPPAGMLGHVMAKLCGCDPKADLDADLLRMKTAIETGHAPHDAAQPGGEYYCAIESTSITTETS